MRHVGKSAERFTVSERIFFPNALKNGILFQSNYVPSFKQKLFWGYPSKQEKKNTQPQNVLTTEIYVESLNNSEDA